MSDCLLKRDWRSNFRSWHQAEVNACRLLRPLIGVKRKCCERHQFDAPDPTRTSLARFAVMHNGSLDVVDLGRSLRGALGGTASHHKR